MVDRGDEADLPSTFPELFRSVVGERPDHPALIADGETLTYHDVDQLSARMARALLALGAGKGTRVALLAPDGAALLAGFYAGLRIGALVTPISTLATPPELAHILRTSDAQVLIGARRFLRRDFAADLLEALPELAHGTPRNLHLSAAPHLRSIFLDDATDLGWAESTSTLHDLGGSDVAPAGALLAAVEAEVSPSDDAFVVYTSGSAAIPKAVVHGQWSVARQPPVLATYFGVTAGDRTMPLLPMFWMGGIAFALQVLATGSTLVYPPSPGIDDVLDTIERHDVTCVVVWHMLAKLRAAAVERGIDVERIRGLGAPVLDGDGQRIPSRFRANVLGMSESFAAHSAEPVGRRLPDDKVGASGRAVNGIERRVVDPETGDEVAPGAVGELQLRGGALMTGFYKVDRRTVFTADGFYPTKDLVRIDADGYAYFVGRTGDMIKTSSANVSRLEVEAALNALPEVELSLVAGLPDPEVGELVAAAVVPAAGATPTEEGLTAALRERLSSFKIPRRIVFITHDDVPRTATGKVQLYELASAIGSRLTIEPPPDATAPVAAHRTSTREKVPWQTR